MTRATLKRLIGILGAALAAVFSSSAQAGYYQLLHDTTDTNETNGSAIVVAAPSSDNGRVHISRIRVSSSKTTSVDFQFRSARESSSLGDTHAMLAWSCSLPGCQDVYAIDGVTSNFLYDMDNLDLILPPGHRLYMYTSADIGADFFSIEVWANDR